MPLASTNDESDILKHQILFENVIINYEYQIWHIKQYELTFSLYLKL